MISFWIAGEIWQTILKFSSDLPGFGTQTSALAKTQYCYVFLLVAKALPGF